MRLTQSSAIDEAVASRLSWVVVTPVGFEPTQLALVELESTPLDHSGKVSMVTQSQADRRHTELWSKRIDGEGIFVQV